MGQGCMPESQIIKGLQVSSKKSLNRQVHVKAGTSLEICDLGTL
jgi:hypothetical protein